LKMRLPGLQIVFSAIIGLLVAAACTAGSSQPVGAGLETRGLPATADGSGLGFGAIPRVGEHVVKSPEAWRKQVDARTADVETGRKWAWYSALNGRPVDARNFLYQAFLPPTKPAPKVKSRGR
jgi:hypothetical protein